MKPIFLNLGFAQIRWYGLMYGVSLLIGIKLILDEFKRRKLEHSEDTILNLILISFIGALIFARIYYVAFNWSEYNSFLDIFAVWQGGLAIHGGMIGGVLFGYLACKFYKVKPWLFADVTIPSILLGQALGRFGNFMNGDAHGIATNMPWGMVFAPGTRAYMDHGMQPSHPTMIYEMLFNLLFFIILYVVQKKVQYRNGFIFCLYLIFYSVGRFIVSFFRADDLYLFGQNLPHMVSIILIACGLYFILRYQLYKPENIKNVRGK